MEFSFKAEVVLELDHIPGEETSRHIATKINLFLSENLNHSQYLLEDSLPNQKGAHALTQVLVQGLISNIHYSHQKGFRNDVEHIKYIIEELTRGLAEVTIVEKSTF